MLSWVGTTASSLAPNVRSLKSPLDVVAAAAGLLGEAGLGDSLLLELIRVDRCVVYTFNLYHILLFSLSRLDGRISSGCAFSGSFLSIRTHSFELKHFTIDPPHSLSTPSFDRSILALSHYRMRDIRAEIMFVPRTRLHARARSRWRPETATEVGWKRINYRASVTQTTQHCL